MYAEFYQFSGMPFQLTPDSRFFFGSSEHSRAISHLVYGLSQDEGFIVITGEVGAGKTTLVERLASQLDPEVYTIARLMTAQLGPADIAPLVATAFAIEPGPERVPERSPERAYLLRQNAEFLRARRAAGHRSLLIVDEVQGLGVPALEELRMLSNLSERGQALLQMILLGQPQFRRTLASPELDQLRQRVLASYHLGPLGAAETEAYIRHRLAAVGGAARPAWEPAAYAAVHRHAGGIPRQINRLCSRALLFGALEQAETITAAMIEETAAELAQDLGGGLATIAGAGPEAGRSSLGERVQQLERVVLRRERIFERLISLLDSYVGAPR